MLVENLTVAHLVTPFFGFLSVWPEYSVPPDIEDAHSSI
jgi:hypothetical protein